MARLESVVFQPHRVTVESNLLIWTATTPGWKVNDLPQLCWDSGKPWREANLWAYESAVVEHKHPRTVLCNAAALLGYAKWLEETNTRWWDFPARKSDRCLYRYRGYLIDARDKSQLSSSTVSQRMRVVVRFYRWLKEKGLLSVECSMWRERVIGINVPDAFGFDRTLTVRSTDLAIPNRPAPGEGLEDGLLPVSTVDRDALLAFSLKHSSEELFLLLTLGFYTGMRLGTLADLKVSTLANAVPDPGCPHLYKMAVGPGAHPSVATKFGVTGQVWIPLALLDRMREYVCSARRLQREALAKPENKELVFITKYGNPYAQRGANKSVAVNVEMSSLRKKAVAMGFQMQTYFRFHQSRCTFATELARTALKHGNATEAIAIVKQALLHRHESSSLAYIKFVERTPVKIEAANEFTRAFLGLFDNARG
jgi:integrase